MSTIWFNEDDFDEVLDLYAAQGTVVASIVGGKTYGVAKNVNIYIIAVNNSKESGVHTLEYIKKKAMVHTNTPTVSIKQKYGNDNVTEKHYLSSYDNFISIAAINNIEERGLRALYFLAQLSNYGECITMHAPEYVNAAMYDLEEIENNILGLKPRNTYNFLSGTSFSALLTSEHPDIEFITKNARKLFERHTRSWRITTLSVTFVNTGKR
ncbi:hypothetical protein H8356DRAFT_1341680 [Neocallimastix lanati (nom. inval.)]|nr:hypothetical protein H8356DRAFT_1341680 [Neocallimastix sp. JGI-2020a]